MPATQPLSWGILGCARISRRGLIPGIQHSEFGRLLAIASRDLSTAQSWASEFGIPRAHGGYEAVIEDPEIQAVYVPLPNELHRPWVERAAEAGKHVLCEKPLSLDARDATAMVEACRSGGVVLMEAFMWRHQARTRGILDLIRGGVIGELRLVRSSFSFPIEADDWRLDPTRGGGALWDVGCYGVNTARLFAGEEPESVAARARFGPGDVDLTLTAELKFPGGVLGLLDCSFEQPFRCSYELVGTRGVIEVPDAYLPPATPSARLWGDVGIRDLKFDGRDQYASMVDAFAEGVSAGGLGGGLGEDGLAQMRVLDALAAAARRV